MNTERGQTGSESAQFTETPAEPTVNDQTGPLQAAVGVKVEDTLTGKERIDLGIDWDSLDKESLFASLKEFDNAETLCPKVVGKRNHDTYLIHIAELKTRTGEKLHLEIVKVISPNYHELQLNLIRPDINKSMPRHYVADFEFLQLKQDQSEEWDMKHRETSDIYRNQGIAGKIIALTEEILRKRSQDTPLSQSISAKSGQKDLTYWLENKKRGFVPAESKDTEMLQRLKANDNDLKEVTMNGETYTFDVKDFNAKFGHNLSGPEDPAVWDFDNDKEPFFYMKSCFKIKMKKSI